MDEAIRFNDLEYDKSNDIVYDTTTGEIIEDKNKLSLAVEDHERQAKYDKAKKKEINKKIGKVYKEDTHHFNWKENSHFIKIYRTEMREYKKSIKLSSNAGLMIFYIQDYIEFEPNRIAKPDGTSFTNKELQELTGLGRDAVEKSLKELEDKHFIRRVGQRQSREIYFNPYLACPGNVVLFSTEKLFEDYKPITPF